jgi:hypothetical protein
MTTSTEYALLAAASYFDTRAAINRLTPLYNASGEFGGRVVFDQWSVAASSTGATATARDATKTQIFIGGLGADTLTNGIAEADFSDVIYGIAGNDKINSSATLNVAQRSKPGDSWSPPAGQRIHRNNSKVSSKYGGYNHISCSKNITPTRHTPNLAAASARAIRNGALQ